MAATASSDQSLELGLAAVAHMSRYRGNSREHTESDLRVFFNWCHDRQLAPLAAQRHDLGLYLRWLQDTIGRSTWGSCTACGNSKRRWAPCGTLASAGTACLTTP